MSEYIEFAVRVPKDEADLFIARFGRKNVDILGYLLGEEIVRCRDCKHYTDDEMEYYHYCGQWCEQVAPDGFCAWGERRSDD